jgi:hypothetical protein
MPIQQIKNDVAIQNKRSANAPRRSTFKNVAKLIVFDEDYQHNWYMDSEKAKRKKAMQFVMVKDKVANVMNGACLIRRAVEAPNGLYNIDQNGWLESIKPEHYVEGYPDVDLLVRYNICGGWYDFNRKDLEVHRLLKSVIPNEIIVKMIGAVSYVKNLANSCGEDLQIKIDHNSLQGAISLDDLWKIDDNKEARIRQECQRGTLYHDFGLKEPIYLNPSFMEIGLIEMSRYSVVGLIRDETAKGKKDYNEKPLVFELDRGNMFVIAPIKR